MTDIGACVKWHPDSRFKQGDRVLMRDGTIWVCVAPGVSCSNWREEAFQIPDGSIVDGSVIWRDAERVKEDENASTLESSDNEEADEESIDGALAEDLDETDTYVLIVTSEDDE